MWNRAAAAHEGDIVMTPTNVRARVIDAKGDSEYDAVEVIELRPLSAYRNTWRQGQLIIQQRRDEFIREWADR